MGWSIGFDRRWNRDIGYGVPAYCDHPSCRKVIDRGLSYVCGGDAYGGDDGCGLYFCDKHLFFVRHKPQRCDRCVEGKAPFSAKADHPRWVKHKATDPSWEQWREEHQSVAKQSERL